MKGKIDLSVKLILLFIVHSIAGKAQFNQGNCPNNIDFEFGNFTNWNQFIGSANNLGGLTPTVGASGRFVVYSPANATGVNDPYGGFPVLCPNGSGFSVQLGEDLGGPAVNDNGQAERLVYTFTIPAGSVRYSLTYFYAAVLNRGVSGHNAANQPRFTVRIRDVLTGQDVGCSYYDYNAQDGASNGFQQSTVGGFNGDVVFFKPWTPVTVDLTGLNGQTIALEFTTNDCHPGAHFGYAYIDIGATCITPVTGYAYCTGATSITLTAPFGYQSYNWFDNITNAPLGTGQTLTISPPPSNGTIINLDLIPFPFGACRDTLPVTIEQQTPPDTPVAQSVVTYCQFGLSNPLVATSLPNYLLQWYLTPTGGTGSVNPPVPSTSTVGTTDYYVSQISFGGCEGPRKKITVNVVPPPTANFSINDTTQCNVGNQFIFTNTSTDTIGGTIFSWDFGDATPLVTTTNAIHSYTGTGTFNVILTATKGSCQTTRNIPITIVSRPIADFTAANGCENQVINFTNTTTGGSASNQFIWDFGGGNTSTQTNPSFTFTTSGIKNIKLTATAGLCTHDTIKQITIASTPIANFTFSQACVNDSIQFTDVSTISTGIITTWNWDFGGGITSTIQNPRMAFANFGPRQVRLTVGTGNCSKDTTITVNVYEKPIAAFNRNDTACLNQSLQLSDASYFASGATNIGIANWWWNNNNGSTYSSSTISTSFNSLSNFEVWQVVTSTQGCVSDTNKVIIRVNPLPVAVANILTPLCENRPLQFQDVSTPNIQARTWTFSNGTTNNDQLVIISNFSQGPQNFKLQVIDSFGCKSSILDSNIIVYKRPSLGVNYLDSCVEKPVPFNAFDLDGAYITNWFWNFEGVTVAGSNAETYQFAKYGNNTIYTYGVTANGCVSDSVYTTINLQKVNARAGNDVIAAANEPIQLNATGGINYSWSPSIGLSNPTISNPIATNTSDKTYEVIITDRYGCTNKDDVTIKIYKGPDIYVPTAFSPNNDGLNDVLKVTLVGIKTFNYLKVYNRLGEIVFETNNASIGWNGMYKNKFQPTAAYVFVTQGVDINGKTINKKGTIVLVR